MATKTTKKEKKSPKKTTKSVKTERKFPSFDKKRLLLLAVSALVVISIILCAVFVRGASYKKAKITALENKAWGIDVSSHNGKIEWKKVAAKADFAFIRVGYRGYSDGDIHADKRAAANLKGAIRHGIPVGVYFYSQAITPEEAEEEAAFVLSRIKDYDIPLPVVFDFEYAYKDDKRVGRLAEAKLTKKDKTRLVNAFCDKIRKAGYTPGVYASSYIYRSHFNMKDIPEDVYIWVADYNEAVTYGGPYDIWQYSEKGACDGVGSDYVDLNYFYTDNRNK